MIILIAQSTTLHRIYKGRGHKLSGFFFCLVCDKDFQVKFVGGEKAHGSKYSFSGLVS